MKNHTINEADPSAATQYNTDTTKSFNNCQAIKQVPCPSCGSTATKLGAGKDPHTASLSCAGCNRWIKWIGKAELTKLTRGAK
jgi:endogenous inhibitor of DNA gyrase (YacG/DUF329 family)